MKLIIALFFTLFPLVSHANCAEDLISIKLTQKSLDAMERQQFSTEDRLRFLDTLIQTPLIGNGDNSFATVFTLNDGDKKKVLLVQTEKGLIVTSIDRAKPDFLTRYQREVAPASPLSEFSEQAIQQRVMELVKRNSILIHRQAEKILRALGKANEVLIDYIQEPVGDRIFKTYSDPTHVGSLWMVIRMNDSYSRVELGIAVDGNEVIISGLRPANASEIRAVLGEEEARKKADKLKSLVISPEARSGALSPADIERLFKNKTQKALAVSDRPEASWFISSLRSDPESLFYVRFAEDEEKNRLVEEVRQATLEEAKRFAASHGIDDVDALRLRPRYNLDIAPAALNEMQKIDLRASVVERIITSNHAQPDLLTDGYLRLKKDLSPQLSISFEYRFEPDDLIISVRKLNFARRPAATVAKSILRVQDQKSTYVPFTYQAQSRPIPAGARPLYDERKNVSLAVASAVDREVNRYQLSDQDIYSALGAATGFTPLNSEDFQVQLPENRPPLTLTFHEIEGDSQLILLKGVEPSHQLQAPINHLKPFAENADLIVDRELQDGRFFLSRMAKKQMTNLGIRASELAQLLWSKPMVDIIMPAGENQNTPAGLFEVTAPLAGHEKIRLSFTPSDQGLVITDILRMDNAIRLGQMVPAFGLTLGVESYFWDRDVRPREVRRRVEQLFANRTGYILKQKTKGYGIYDIFWFLSDNGYGQVEKVVYSISPITLRAVILYVGEPRRYDESRYAKGIGAHNFYFDFDQNKTLIIGGDLRAQLEAKGQFQIHEIEEVLSQPTAEEVPTNADQFLRIGQTEAGRTLKVVYRKVSDYGYRVLSVRSGPGQSSTEMRQ